MAPKQSETSLPSSKRKVTRRRVVYDPLECLVCHERFSKITAAHLNSHGLSIDQYCRTYSLPRDKFSRGRPPGGLATPLSPLTAAGHDEALALIHADPRKVEALSRQVLAALLERGTLATELSKDVERGIVTTELRPMLTASLVTIVAGRMEAHGRATETLAALQRELSQPWRREQGGAEGGVTETRDLVAMTQTAIADLKATDEVILKVLKLAVDEQREREKTHPAGDLAEKFQGTSAPPLPADLTPADRETMRGLALMLRKGLEARAKLREAAQAKPAEVLGSSPPSGAAVQVDGAPAAPTSATPTPMAPAPLSDSPARGLFAIGGPSPAPPSSPPISSPSSPSSEAGDF